MKLYHVSEESNIDIFIPRKPQRIDLQDSPSDATDSLKCLKECYRVLKNNGILIIGYINKYLGLEWMKHVPVDGKVFSDIDCSTSIDEIQTSLSTSNYYLDKDLVKSSIHSLYVGKKS